MLRPILRLGKVLLVTVMSFISLVGVSLAMHTTVQESLVAWSEDGKRFLLYISEHGPEGGGSKAYRLICPGEQLEQTFELSSNFSPGDGSRPETVSDQACREAATKLKQQLRQLGFKGVSVDLQAKQRFSMVNFDPAAEERVNASKVTQGSGRVEITADEIRIELAGDTSTAREALHMGSKATLTIPLSEHAAGGKDRVGGYWKPYGQGSVTNESPQVFVAPNGPLLLVFNRQANTDDCRLTGIFVWKKP